MKYYKYNSIPLEQEYPGIGDKSWDEYGNYVEINMFNEPDVLIKSVLNDGEKINEFENINFLRAFWKVTNKVIVGYEIYNED